MTENQGIIVVSGLSGAGKTTTMSIFEDMGYLTIDNLPHQLLTEFVKHHQADSQGLYQKVILGVNIMNLAPFLHDIEKSQLQVKVLMLVSSPEELLHRYKHNRRVHPLVKTGQAKSILEAIHIEQQEVDRLKSQTHTLIDTTYLSQRELIQKIEFHRELKFEFSTSIIFHSFGYRFGIPLDSDYVIDVRFLDNPYWDKLLREKTGDHQEIIDYVHRDPKTKRLFDSLVTLFDHVIDGAIHAGRQSISIGIGCTGGQHRSVVIVNDLYQHYLNNRLISQLQNGKQIELKLSYFHRDKDRNLLKILSEENSKKEEINE